MNFVDIVPRKRQTNGQEVNGWHDWYGHMPPRQYSLEQNGIKGCRIT